MRLFEQRHIPLNMAIALPNLDGIKRAVELKLGAALLPRRCAIIEIASGRLVAVPVTGVSRRRQVTLVCRRAHRSHAARRVSQGCARESHPDLVNGVVAEVTEARTQCSKPDLPICIMLGSYGFRAGS